MSSKFYFFFTEIPQNKQTSHIVERSDIKRIFVKDSQVLEQLEGSNTVSLQSHER